MFANSDDVHSYLIGIRIPPPFYLSHRYNNCIINTRDASTIILKFVADERKLYRFQCIDGVIQLYSFLVDVIGSVKGVTITLNAFPNICVMQDIIVVYLIPLFRIYLFR